MNEKSKKSGYAALKQLAKAPLKPAIRVDADSPKPRVRGPRDVSRKLRPRTTDASVGLRAKPAQREEYAIEPNPPGIQMGVQRLSIDETAEGQRIDNYLLRVLKGVPRSAFTAAILFACRRYASVNRSRKRQSKKKSTGCARKSWRMSAICWCSTSHPG